MEREHNEINIRVAGGGCTADFTNLCTLYRKNGNYI